MASLPKVPFTDIQDFRVAVDAPVSTDLMTDFVVNENYLKSVLTDGAAAPQSITTNDVNTQTLEVVTATVSGTETANNLTVTGIFSASVFFISDFVVFLSAL